MEIAYLALYGVCSSDLSSLGVGIVADEVRIEYLVDHFRLALTEGFFQEAAHGGLVHYRHGGLRHRGLLSPLLLSLRGWMNRGPAHRYLCGRTRSPTKASASCGKKVPNIPSLSPWWPLVSSQLLSPSSTCTTYRSSPTL